MSFRLRLALWIGSVVAASTAFVVVVALAVHSRTHYNSLDLALVDDAEHYRTLVLASGESPAEWPPRFSSSTSAFLYAADGTLLTHSLSAGKEPPLDARGVIERDDGPAYGAPWNWIPRGESFDEGWFATVRDPDTGERVRLYVREFDYLPGDGRYVLTWTSLARLDRSIAQFRLLMLAAGTVAIVGAVAGSFLAGGRVLRPIMDVMRTARAIAVSRGFARRLPEPERRDEMGQLARTLNEMLQSLEDAYRVQQQFVADAAHELRTPLAAIRSNLHVLTRLEGDSGGGGESSASVSDRARALAYLETEAARMSQMVDELLTLARADAGLQIDRAPVELDAVLLGVVAEVSVMVEERVLEVEKVEPVVVNGDAPRLKQLALILLDNAIKYTAPQDSIRVSLERHREEAILRVQDTGIGIAPEDLRHVFERFYRGERGRNYYPGGTGLGLAIARWVVDAHDGEITVESEPGKGTRVTVRLPAQGP